MKPVIRIIVVVALAISALYALAQKAPHVKFTAQQAVKIATAKYPGKVVGKVELENEEGSWQYAVNIKSGKKLREVMVSAMTGKIANVEVTTAKEEAREKAAEKNKKKGG